MGVERPRLRGLAAALATINHTSRRAPCLTDEIEVIRAKREKIAPDEGMRNLHLFRVLVAARVELHFLDLAKSEPGLRQFAQNLDRFLGTFPFTRRGYDQLFRDQLEIVRDRARDLDPQRAAGKTTDLFHKFLEILDLQLLDQNRLAAGNITPRSLEEIAVGRGPAEGISQLAEERDQAIAEREEIGRHLDKLQAGDIARLEQVGRALSKKTNLDKAAAFELFRAALEFMRIGQEGSLVRALVELGREELDRRNEYMGIRLEGLIRLKTIKEVALGRQLIEFANRKAAEILRSPKLDIPTLERVRDSLYQCLGAKLGPSSEALSVYWLRQARAHLAGVAEKMKKLVENGGGNVDDATRAARTLLEIEFDFLNRHQPFPRGRRQVELRKFLIIKASTHGWRIVPPETPADRQTELGF